MADAFGNTIVLNLSGTSTFRQTATASKVYNLEYFMLPCRSPIATNTLRPYQHGQPLAQPDGRDAG